MLTTAGLSHPAPPVASRPMSNCILWTGAMYSNGYGRAPKPGGGWIGAHVLAVYLDGRPVPRGYHVHHRCNTPACVNPAHLEVLTPAAHGEVHRPGVCRNGHPRERSVLKADGRVAYCRDCRNDARRSRPNDDPSRIADRERVARSYARRKASR